jgi:hypothetical protein
MSQQMSPKKPWLAAGLTLLVMGLGQAYLRRWLRAVGWAALAVLVAALFVPEAALADPGSATFWDVAPLVAVAALSVLDAYALARQHNVRVEIQDAKRCANCHHELEGEFSFCPWCATELTDAEQVDDTTVVELPERDER